MPLGMRITGSDWTEGGLTPDDAVAFARALKDAGLDFVCVSSGGISADTRPAATPGLNVAFAERVRREAGIATRVVGLIATPRQAEAVIAGGKADMVALGRPGVGEAFLAEAGFDVDDRFEIPFVLEYADPDTFARALAATGPSYESMQSIGEAAFLERTRALAEARVREGLPLRGAIQEFGYVGTKA